ncbi:MAG TPA: hypothetical protein VLZ74_09615 [Methylocella sp.]|nr:hypothetical protein [Methylocella sp.]
MFARRVFSLVSVSAASILFGLLPVGRSVAQDVRHECSEKYQAAKAAGTLNDQTWPQFYSKCTAEAKESAAAASASASPPLDVRHICSEKYQSAKAAGTLGGDTWPQFYSKCVAEVKANPPAAATPPAETAAAPAPEAVAPAPAPAPAPVAEAPAPPPAVEAQAPPPPAAAPAPPPAAAPAPANPLKTPAPKAAAAASGSAVFPSAISPKYASLTPAKGRQKTCLDQYNANKAINANGGLKWIQKGGGYWSECNKHLKG